MSPLTQTLAAPSSFVAHVEFMCFAQKRCLSSALVSEAGRESHDLGLAGLPESLLRRAPEHGCRACLHIVHPDLVVAGTGGNHAVAYKQQLTESATWYISARVCNAVRDNSRVSLALPPLGIVSSGAARQRVYHAQQEKKRRACGRHVADAENVCTMASVNDSCRRAQTLTGLKHVPYADPCIVRPAQERGA